MAIVNNEDILTLSTFSALYSYNSIIALDSFHLHVVISYPGRAFSSENQIDSLIINTRHIHIYSMTD